MKQLLNIVIINLISLSLAANLCAQGNLVWPPAPDKSRIEHIGEIRCEDLKPGKGLLGKISRLIGGHQSSDDISLPFEPLIVGDELFLICQNFNGLIIIDRNNNTFRIAKDKKNTLQYPIGLCRGQGQEVYLSDSKSSTVYRYASGQLEPLITDGLLRPTGIAVNKKRNIIYIVDTGVHKVLMFDLDGAPLGSSPNYLGSFPNEEDQGSTLNFPIAITLTSDESVLVNDALNFQIKKFTADGAFIDAFGFEGNSPGAFARPKGIALDSDEHVYVVDNLFDNFQIFDKDGANLLAVGSAGQSAGEFWSPAGIDIVADTLFVADTYNNRIQMFHYLGDTQ